MKTFPFYKQPDQTDCGPTCIRMVAKHYGENFSLQRLRDIAGLNKEGVSLLGISEAAEKIGFRTIGSRLTLQQLYKVKGKRNKAKGGAVFYIADPGKGLFKYTEAEFLQRWLSTHNNGHSQGIALMLTPSPAFYEQDGDQTGALNFGFLLRYLCNTNNLLYNCLWAWV